MSGFFGPNLKILKDWKSSLATAFSQLRRVPFVVEDTFEWTDFDASPNFNGMTVTNRLITAAKGIKLNQLFFFTVELSATLAAPFTNTITFTIPYALSGTITRLQGGGCITQNGLPFEAGIWGGYGTTNQIFTVRTAANYAAGTGTIRVNGFVEVI